MAKPKVKKLTKVQRLEQRLEEERRDHAAQVDRLRQGFDESIKGSMRGLLTQEYALVQAYVKFSRKLNNDLVEHERMLKEALIHLGVQL